MEKYFPRFKKFRYDSDKGTGHKEKNYYSHVILDCQEWILKTFFGDILSNLELRGIKIEEDSFKTEEECCEIMLKLDAMGNYDVDSVGQIIKRKATTNMTEVDFSLGRVDVREMQRKMAIEAEGTEERISSVDSSEQLKVKKKTEASGSFH